nr:uncharacterized protein LOC123747179 [Procambarus clarkii]
MASKQDLEEIYAAEKEVAPGWTFCKSNRKFYPNDKAFKSDTNSCIKYNIRIQSGKQLENRKHYSSENSFSKDLGRINCSNALFVNGVKIMEIRGSNIAAHDLMHTVVAVNHKYFADMLLIFTNKIEDDVKKQIEESLLKILYENSECIFSEEVLKTFNCAFIYENLFSTGVRIADIEESKTKYCHLLQNSCVSKLPMTVLLGKPNQLISSRPLNSGQNINGNSDSSITTNVSYAKDLTGKNSDKERSVSPEESVVPQGLQKLVRNSGTCQAQPPRIIVQEEHFQSPRQKQQLLTSCSSTHPAHSQHRDVQEEHIVNKGQRQQALTSSSGIYHANSQHRDLQEEHIVTKGHGQQALTSSSETHPAHPHHINVQEEHIVNKGQRQQALTSSSGTYHANSQHRDLQEEHIVTKGQRQQALTSSSGTHPAHSQHRDVQEEHIVTERHGQQAVTSSSGSHPAHSHHRDVQDEHIVTKGERQQALTSSSDTHPAHSHHRDVQEEHIVAKEQRQQALTSSSDTQPAHSHHRDVQEEHIVTKGQGYHTLTSSSDTYPAHPHHRDLQEVHIVTKGQGCHTLTSSSGAHRVHPHHRDVQEVHIVTRGQGYHTLTSSSDTYPAHPHHRDFQEVHIVTKGQGYHTLTSSSGAHPVHPHDRDVQEVHIVTKGQGCHTLTSCSSTHPAHSHHRDVQEEHIVTKRQRQQSLTSSNDTHHAISQHRDLQEEHSVPKRQGYHTLTSSSGICQNDYDHSDVQRVPLISSGQELQTLACICGTCQAHNLYSDVQNVEEPLVCSQKENLTIACSNDSCLGHCPQRAAQKELICPKSSSNCGKTILPKVTSPSNSSCSQAQVTKSCYRTSQNIDCSKYIMKDSDISVSQKGKTDRQNIMKDSDMSVSNKGKTESQNMKDSDLSLSKKEKTDSQNVTKDSDVTLSKKGKNNNRSLQEPNGRSQKMAKSLKKGNSETKDNSRSLSAQNQRDYSTLTDRKENTSSKNIKPHIINPVKSQKDPSGMERKFYGNSISNHKEKVVILLGASGSGKTTLVNFIANYFQGAKVADDMLVYVDANSSSAKPTTTITAYTFCTDENHAPITVIDTPGLNDSSRKEVDDIKQFLANAASHKIDIHAIGFVVQAHLVRLTSSERLILDYVSSLFGQSVAHHLIMFVTAADNQEIPLVVEAMRNCNIKSKTFFKFNNSATNNKVQEIDEFDKLYWRMGYKSWKKCLKLLLDLPQLSVNTFKALQNKVYSGKVIESAARDLKEELKNFVHLCKDHKYMTKEALEKCEQVWEQAVVFNHLKCTQESGVSDVESILKSFAMEVCRGNSFNSNECIDLLFLGGSKGILAAGMGVISSMGPLYENAKKYHNPKHDDKQVPSILHCVRCKDDHQITREVLSGPMSYIPGLGKSREIITFKCTKCDCDGSLHKDVAGEKLLASFDLSSQLLLRNTKTVITKLLQKRHFSEWTINEDKYLHLINIALDYKYKIFIEELLKS